ncbi:MAG: hypothetical protein II008_18825 [Oscillospiraceae bacterium]|nr:hypothetical protein [Oscillospiraceae bacterium]
MNQKERYIVCTKDGKSHTCVDTTYGEILREFGEDKVWMMIRLDYQEVET